MYYVLCIRYYGYADVCVYIYIYIYIPVYVYVYVYMYMYIYIGMYVCVYDCVSYNICIYCILGITAIVLLPGKKTAPNGGGSILWRLI